MRQMVRKGGQWLAKSMIIGAVLSLSAFSAAAQDDVDVRFSWKLKGEYAPFYHALNTGAFKAKKLNVSLGEGAGSQAALGALVQGQEDVVVMPAIFAMTAIQRGMPVKIIALYHRRAPVVMISSKDNPIKKPADLVGKTLASAVGETGTAYLDSFCAVNSIDCDSITLIQMDRSARVPAFLQGQVDGVTVYASNDLPLLEAQTGTKYQTMNMGEHGLAVPGMAVVASDDGIANKADVLKRFLAAVGASIGVAKADPKVAAASLVESWPGAPDMPVVVAQVQATVDAIAEMDGRPEGWVNADDIQNTLDMLVSAGDIEKPLPAEAFFTNALLAN